MVRLLVGIVMIGVLAALVIGCSSSTEDSTATSEAPASTQAVATVAPAPQSQQAAPVPTSAPVVKQQPAPAAPAAPAATAAPVVAPKEVESSTMIASEFIAETAMALGVPVSYIPIPDPYEPVYGGSAAVGTLEWVVPSYWDWPIKIGHWNGALSHYAEGLGMFHYGPEYSPVDYSSQPGVAENWEISGDGTTYTFDIRKGVKWGIDPGGIHEWLANDVDLDADVTAHDYVAAAGMSFGIEASSYIPKFNMIDGPESFKALDDYTLQITTNQPSAPLIFQLTHKGPWILGRQGIDKRMAEEGLELQEAMNDLKVQIGTGPWIIEEWEPASSISFAKNPSYWGTDGQGNQIPFLDKMTIHGIQDERLQDAAFRTGKLGGITLETCGLSPQRYQDIKQSNPDTNFEVFVDPMNVRGLGLNWGESGDGEGKPWGDLRVRHAMQLAVDKEGWVESILIGWGLPYPTPLAPGNQWWLQPGQYGDSDGDGVTGEDLMKYDPVRAKELLAEAGYPDGFDAVLGSTHGVGATWFSESELYAESLRNIGINVTMDVKDGAARSAARTAGEFDFIYEFPCWGFEPVDWFGPCYFSPEQKQSQPVSGLVDLELDRMIIEMNQKLDPEERFEAVADLQRYLMEKQYYIYATNWIQIVAIAPWFKNYSFHYTHQIGQGTARAWVEQ